MEIRSKLTQAIDLALLTSCTSGLLRSGFPTMEARQDSSKILVLTIDPGYPQGAPLHN